MEGGHDGYKRGLWNVEEDRILINHVKEHGIGNWNRIAKVTGLKRCGKSCRLRWMNHLNPTVKHGDFSEDEEDLIIRLHKLLGNRWSLIAGRVPGRTDNQVKNYWNTRLSKKLGFRGKSKVFSPPKALPDQPNQNPSSLSESKSAQPLNVSDGREKGENQKSDQTRSPWTEIMQEIIMIDDLQRSFWCDANNDHNLYSSYLTTDTFYDNLIDIDWGAL